MNTETNIFKNKPACTHSLIVYVPSTQGLSDDITLEAHTQRTQDVATHLSSLFGGATITPSQGYYIADNGQKVIEGVNQVATACNWADLQADKGQAVSQLVADKKTEWGQESIAIELIENSKMFFV